MPSIDASLVSCPGPAPSRGFREQHRENSAGENLDCAVCTDAWYHKPWPTFADALARLRRHLWFDQVVTSLETDDMTKASPPLLRRLIDQACYAS